MLPAKYETGERHLGRAAHGRRRLSRASKRSGFNPVNRGLHEIDETRRTLCRSSFSDRHAERVRGQRQRRGCDGAPFHRDAAVLRSAAGMTIPATSIGLPTAGGTVTTATVVAASGTGAAALPEYCLVNGAISPVDSTAPEILFKLALPTTWNSKVVMLGRGGFDGTVPNVTGNVPAGPTDQPTPLGRGYATFGSDSGHHAERSRLTARNRLRQRRGFAHWADDAIKKTRDTALYLINLRYAAGSPIKASRRTSPAARTAVGRRSRPSNVGRRTGTARSPGTRRGTISRRCCLVRR